MYYSRYRKRSPAESTAASNHQSSEHRLKSPVTSDYEYLGRLVTRERPVARKPKSVQQNLIFPQNRHKYDHSMGAHGRDIYKGVVDSSTDDDNDDSDDLTKPLGVIRINDRHYREIYRLPTPPPKVKRVFHRLQSPEPKIIERVYVRRPPPQIIENVVEVPPEKVRIINREKYLERAAPVTRSKLVHLKSRHHQREEELQPQQQYEETYLPSEQHSQQQTSIPSEQYSQRQATMVPSTTTEQSPGTATTLVYPPQANMRTVGYIKSTVPPEVMFNSSQPLQIPASQISDQQTVQSTPYNNPSQQITNQQMLQSTPYDNPSQQMASQQILQSTTFGNLPQQFTNQQIVQPTPFGNLPQQFANQQIVQPTPFGNLPQQFANQQIVQPATNYQMVQPNAYNYPLPQPVSYQMTQPTAYPFPSQQPVNHQMVQPTLYPFPSQPTTMPFSSYGYPQY